MASRYSCDKCGREVSAGSDRVRLSIYEEFDLCHTHWIAICNKIRGWVNESD